MSSFTCGTAGAAVRIATVAAVLPFLIAPVATGAVVIESSTLPPGVTGTWYSASLKASGGVLPYRWSYAPGSEIPGIHLDPVTGQLSGTPQGIEPRQFTLEVMDAAGDRATRSLRFSVDSIPVVSHSLSGLSYGGVAAANVTGGSPPYTWSLADGVLPRGISLDTTTGALLGVLQEFGTAAFTAKATDAGGRTAWASYTFEIGGSVNPGSPSCQRVVFCPGAGQSCSTSVANGTATSHRLTGFLPAG